jgi:ferredoxin
MAGIHVGNPRLAVYSASRYAENGCVYCGMCMYGCPYELIYKSGDSLQEWLKLGKMRYVDRLFVEQVGDRGRTATLRARDLTSGETLQIDCARIYLAAGTIPTTKLILDSLQYYNKRISALDSQMFLTPVFKSHATPGFVEDEQFTLTQLFFELVDRRECARSVHFQIYPYNDLVGKAVKQFFPRRVWESAVFKNQALSRLMIMQGLLDSKYSPSLDFTLRRDSDRTVLCIRGVPNPRTRGVIRAALWKIARHGRKLGAFAVPFFARLGSPGQSYHCGGSFPMSAAPRGLETDSLGRVAGLGRVHAVDASVLPSIPPTTITFTVMANAHRIASQGPSS